MVGSAASIDPLIDLLRKLEKIQKAGSGGGVDFSTPGTGGTTGQNSRCAATTVPPSAPRN